MSHAATAWVLDHSKSKANDRNVLYVIADATSEKEGQGLVAYPGIAWIADKANASPATVKRSIAALVELGELVVEARNHTDGPHRSNLYRMPGLVGGQGSTVSSGQGSLVSPQEPLHGTSGTDVPGGTDVVTPSSDSPPARPRQRNPLFDTLARVCDINVDEITPPQAKRVGTALALIKRAREVAGKELRVGDIEARAARYRRKYPHASLTPTALSAHWAELGPGQTPPSDLIPGDVMGGTR